MFRIESTVDTQSPEYRENLTRMQEVVQEYKERLAETQLGGPAKYRELHKSRDKLLARERLEKLFDRIRQIEDDLDPNRTGKVFNVVGDMFPSNYLEKMIREMYLHNQTEDAIKARIVEEQLARRDRRAADHPRYQDALDRLTAAGVAAVDLRGGLARAEQPFFARDTHWTPEGVRVVAEAVAAAGSFPALTPSVSQPYLFSDLALTLAATEREVQQFELSIDNHLITDRFMNSTVIVSAPEAW